MKRNTILLELIAISIKRNTISLKQNAKSRKWARNFACKLWIYRKHSSDIILILGLILNIVYVLFNTHGIKLSLRKLNKILEKISLYQRKGEMDIMHVINFIRHDQRGSGLFHGYRWMYQKLNCHGLNPRKEDVRLLLQLLDPEGTELCQRHSLR